MLKEQAYLNETFRDKAAERQRTRIERACPGEGWLEEAFRIWGGFRK